MSKNKARRKKALLPLSIIKAATRGKVNAINKVLAHYQGFIITLSRRKYYDENGRTHYFIDDEIRRTLETQLIVRILQFDVIRAAA
jgi:hypothetical protein